MNKKVIVIGAGVAGLASAIRLHQAGYDIELFEKEALPGGKMHRIKKDSFKFDLGRRIVDMPELNREIFELCGREPDDYIPMQKLDPMFQVYFKYEMDRPYKGSIRLDRNDENAGKYQT